MRPTPRVRRRAQPLMTDLCAGCRDELNTGDTVYQLAWGRYMRSCITPTYDPWTGPIIEWHTRCAPVNLAPQVQPYFCVVCSELVDDGEEVAYVTVGDKPIPPYKRLERRGYELPLIAHLNCWPAP